MNDVFPFRVATCDSGTMPRRERTARPRLEDKGGKRKKVEWNRPRSGINKKTATG
jgi:hypothetical protein